MANNENLAFNTTNSIAVKFAKTSKTGSNALNSSTANKGTILFSHSGQDGTVGEIWVDGKQYGGGGTGGGKKASFTTTIPLGGISKGTAYDNTEPADILKSLLSVEYVPYYTMASVSVGSIDKFVGDKLPTIDDVKKKITNKKVPTIISGDKTFTAGDGTIDAEYTTIASGSTKYKAGDTVASKMTVEATYVYSWAEGSTVVKTNTDNIVKGSNIKVVEKTDGIESIAVGSTKYNDLTDIKSKVLSDEGKIKASNNNSASQADAATQLTGKVGVNFWNKFYYFTSASNSETSVPNGTTLTQVSETAGSVCDVNIDLSATSFVYLLLPMSHINKNASNKYIEKYKLKIKNVKGEYAQEMTLTSVGSKEVDGTVYNICRYTDSKAKAIDGKLEIVSATAYTL